MTKKDLVDTLYNQTELSKQDIALVVNLFLDTILEQVSNGERIELRGFGSFFLQEKKARQIFSPISKKNVDVPNRFNLMFKASKTNQITGD